MNKTFASLEYSNLERVCFFAYQLHWRAHDQWRMVVVERDPSLPITWVDFRDEFLDMYFSANLRI